MENFEVVMRNSLGLEVSRIQVESDDDIFPLTFPLRMGDGELLETLTTMVPGDTIELVRLVPQGEPE
jgi:hypothetical protein